jgi:hypothetical protein
VVASQPGAAQGLLLHADEPGVPLWRSAEAQMCGEIKIGTWRRFHRPADLHPGRGLLWAATLRFC